MADAVRMRLQWRSICYFVLPSAVPGGDLMRSRGGALVTSDLREPRGRAHRAREPCGLPRERRGAYINGDAVVMDGGKMQSGGGGASTQLMLAWTDEQWEAIRPKKK